MIFGFKQAKSGRGHHQPKSILGPRDSSDAVVWPDWPRALRSRGDDRGSDLNSRRRNGHAGGYVCTSRLSVFSHRHGLYRGNRAPHGRDRGLGYTEKRRDCWSETLIEVIGFLVIILGGIAVDPSALVNLSATVLPPLSDTGALEGVLAANLITFFTFNRFGDIVNLVVEARSPRRDLPCAIAITLYLVTLIYVLISLVAIRAVPA
ncbi:APC family permease [Roseovarius bejariae]|uniref:APC family permease n=1 Tax=Roseovarius bejariae TaxID=2576383 RepID=UPI0012AE9E80